MLSIIKTRWQNLLAGFWFRPGIVTLAFALLAVVATSLDAAVEVTLFDFVFGGDISAARGILSTIAGSLITVAGVTLSITVVTLQLVAGQYTPRALRILLADLATQLTAGAFVGVFLYCLLVLLRVGGDEAGNATVVPRLSVTLAIVLSVLALGVLLFFIHHTAQSIQVSSIVARIARRTLATIKKPVEPEEAEPVGDSGREAVEEWRQRDDGRDVFPGRPGYLQNIDLGDLMKKLPRASRFAFHAGPGDFVTQAVPLATVWGVDDVRDVVELIHRAANIDNERDLSQDVDFGIQMLADIAMRALSPAMNDPTTARSCLSYLRSILEELATHDPQTDLFVNRENDVYLALPARAFEDRLHLAFRTIGRYAADSFVARDLLDALAHVARAAQGAGKVDRAAAVRRLAEEFAAAVLPEQEIATGRRDLEDALGRVPLR